MYLDRYSYHADDNFLHFRFTSEGAKGKVAKMVIFSRIRHNLFNLAFGDLDKACGRINDMVVTNNGDSIKVLATVAAIAHDFSLNYPKAMIFIKGSTHSRTRLYRRGITHHWQDIIVNFKVLGSLGTGWEPFIFGKDYDAFLIKRNDLVTL